MRCSLLLLAALVACGQSGQPAPAPRPPPSAEQQRAVLVVSIDGLRRDYLDDHLHELPTIQRLVRDGVVARSLVSVWPSVTYPAHTTLVTGATPIHHGIMNNLVLDPDEKNKDGWHWYASDIRVPTLWDVAADADIDVVNVAWPVTVGARIRWSFPQYWRTKTDEDDKLVCALSSRGLCDELYTAGLLVPNEHRTDFERALAGSLLLHTKRPRLAFVYLTDLDTTQHDHGPMSPEAWTTLKRIDGHLGVLIAAARRAHPRTTVVLVSDHGFARVTKETRLNAIVRAAGLQDRIMVWRAGGTAAIIPRGTIDDETRAHVRAVFEQRARDPEMGIAHVWEGADIARAGGFGNALFVLEAAPGFMFAEPPPDKPKDDLVVAPSKYKGAHGYPPATKDMAASLVLWGDGIRPADLGDVQMIDVAPTIAALLGFTLAEADGHPLKAALAP